MEVKSEQAFREKISHFPCLHLPREYREAREAAPLLSAPEEEGPRGREHACGERNGLDSSWYALQVRALGQTMQSPPEKV